MDLSNICRCKCKMYSVILGVIAVKLDFSCCGVNHHKMCTERRL